MTGNPHIKTGLRAVFAIAVLAAALVLPAQAFAKEDCSNAGSDPTQAQYCSVGAVNTGNGNNADTAKSVPVSDTTSSSPAAVETSSSGSLPFTGLDVGILLLVAVILTGTGLALRRLTASGAHRS